MKKKKIIILYNRISKHPSDDELDVLEQVELVSKSLKSLNYKVKYLEFDLNLKKVVKKIRKANPYIIFNLAESILNKGEFAYLAPSILTYLNIPFTGNPLLSMFNSSNKLLSKRELLRIGVKTPNYFTLDDLSGIDVTKKYIIKPVWEEGSLELDEHCVFNGSDTEIIDKISKKNKDYYFVEEFIDGREFNVSIIGTDDGPKVLPIAEMTFNYPDGKPKMMGYKSKWIETSFEYENTVRKFEVSNNDNIKEKVEEICKKCWNEIGFKGYVRIDFRIDEQNNPYVIDLNLNPCISESGGFFAACIEEGYISFDQVIEQIIKEALK